MSDSCVRTPSSREEPAEQRVVRLVVDEEAGVEREPVVETVFAWPPARSSRSKTSTSWAREQHVRRAEAGDAAPMIAIRINRYSPAANTGSSTVRLSPSDCCP